MTEERTNRAWTFWQESAGCIERIQHLLQRCATIAAAEPPTDLSSQDVREIRRNIARFNEKFALLVREQKRKAARLCQS